MFSRYLRAALGGAAVSFHAAAALAEDPPVALEWSAPSGCPGGADVLARVKALLDTSRAGGGTQAAVRGVVTLGGGEASVRLETRVSRMSRGAAAPETLSGVRKLAGATCDEVTSAAALVIALAIDPDAAPKDSPSAAAAERPEATAETPPTAPPPPAPPETAETANAPAPPMRSSAEWRRVHPFARADVLADFGSLPAAALGLRAAGGVVLPRARAEVGVGYFPPTFAPANTTSADSGAEVSLLVGHLRGCYVFLPERLAMEGCLGAEAGAITAEGQGFPSTSTVVSPWLAAEASAGLGFTLSRNLQLGVSAGALVPFGRSAVRFGSSGSEGARTFKEFHRPSAVGLRLALGITVLFR